MCNSGWQDMAWAPSYVLKEERGRDEKPSRFRERYLLETVNAINFFHATGHGFL